MTVQFTNVSNDERVVRYGVPRGWSAVPVGGQVDINDDAAASYDCQPNVWRRDTPAAVEPVPEPTPITPEPEAAPLPEGITQ